MSGTVEYGSGKSPTVASERNVDSTDPLQVHLSDDAQPQSVVPTLRPRTDHESWSRNTATSNVGIMTYEPQKVIGRGAFGVVMSARVRRTGEMVAVKRVVAGSRLYNRELALMRDHLGPESRRRSSSPPDATGSVIGCGDRRNSDISSGGIPGAVAENPVGSTWATATVVPYHPCIIKLLDHFLCGLEGEQYLLIVMDYFPLDVHRLNHKYVRQRGHRMPLIMIKTIMFQLARALVFLHARSICHRDAKPGNLLVDSETGVVKLCDFGCAKKMQPLGDHEPPEKNVSYICSRPYRAPELLLGSLYYRFHVDMWAFGCVLAELLCGKVLFMGSSTVDQMIEIFKVLGVPSTQELAALNPHFTSMPGMTASPWSAVHGFQFETATPSSPTSSNPHGSDYFQRYQALHVKSLQWDSVLPPNTPESAISLIGGLLRYTPGDRLTAAEVLEHAFFDDLFAADARLPNGNPLPVSMFQVTKEELEVLPPWLLERMAVSERVAKENQASTQPEA